jgi:hypothetical protein
MLQLMSLQFEGPPKQGKQAKKLSSHDQLLVLVHCQRYLIPQVEERLSECSYMTERNTLEFHSKRFVFPCFPHVNIMGLSKESQLLSAAVKGLEWEQHQMQYSLVHLLHIHLWDLVHLGTQMRRTSLLLGTSYKTTKHNYISYLLTELNLS